MIAPRQWRTMRDAKRSRAQETRASQRGGSGRAMLAGIVLGALGMFILDPRTGRRRRALARDKVVRLGNSVDELISETIPRRTEYLSGFAEGMRHRAMRVRRRDQAIPDEDQFITDRVRSIVFRDPAIPKGQISVNTVDRVVYLRGQVDDERMVEMVEDRVRKVEGVREVINLINRPDLDPSAIRAAQERQMH